MPKINEKKKIREIKKVFNEYDNDENMETYQALERIRKIVMK